MSALAHPRLPPLLCLALAVLGGACEVGESPQDDEDKTDVGEAGDAGDLPATDGGDVPPADAGSPPDADAGEEPDADAGEGPDADGGVVVTDAGVVADAGAPDAGTPPDEDADGGIDSGTDAGADAGTPPDEDADGGIDSGTDAGADAGVDDDDAGAPPGDDDLARGRFPSGLALASPLARGTPAPGFGVLSSHAPSAPSGFAGAASLIDDVLTGAVPVEAVFDPHRFLSRARAAPCFGPRLDFVDHPDGPLPNSGQLPPGDLGLWRAQDTDAEACAAAQLNARLDGSSEAANMALLTAAALYATATSGPGIPAPGDDVDLRTEMNALGLATFTRAALAQTIDGVWLYGLEFSFVGDTGPHTVSAELEHAPSADADHDEGLLVWTVDGTFRGGNCGFASVNDVTHNNSLHYVSVGESQLRLQHREATLCGHGSSALTEPVGTAVNGNAVSPLSPWADNFAIFTADFSPTNLSGSYAYTWQAGSMDSDSRVLFVGLNDHSPVDGEAYFGFGDRVQLSTAGDIRGFYCSWAAPGSSRTRHDYAQRQFISYDAALGVFALPSAAASNIIYAPTNSCRYDGVGTFIYDRNLDNVLDAGDVCAVVDAPAGSALAFDLMDTTFGPTTYGTIMEAIAGRGFDKPVYP